MGEKIEEKMAKNQKKKNEKNCIKFKRKTNEKIAKNQNKKKCKNIKRKN